MKSLYFIAEIGVNHEGNLETARKMIEEIAKTGADAVKFQTYKADLLAAINSPAYWDTKNEITTSQHKLFSKYDQFGEFEYKTLYQDCKNHKIDFLSTPFDINCLEWLVPLMPLIKIASADLTNNILLEACAKYKKPMVLSTGASTDDEISYAIDLLKSLGVNDITILHCMLLYPTKKEDAYLSRISYLKEKFKDVKIGYSDHVPSETANNDHLIIAHALGCEVIEKHYTFDKSLPGNDHYHSLNFEELANVIDRLKTVDKLISSNNSFAERGLSIQEAAIKNARRSLYYNKNFKSGHKISFSDFIAKRPGFGMSPKKYKSFIGKTLKHNVSKDDLLKIEDFE